MDTDNDHNHDNHYGDGTHSDKGNHSDNESEHENEHHDDDEYKDNKGDDDGDGGDNDINNDEIWCIDDLTKTNDQAPEINILNAVISSPPASPFKNAGVGGRNTGVGEQNINLENDDASGSEINSNASESENNNEQDQLSCAMDECYGSRSHNINLRNCKPRKYGHLYGPKHMLATFEQPLGELFMTEQMSLKKAWNILERAEWMQLLPRWDSSTTWM